MDTHIWLRRAKGSAVKGYEPKSPCDELGETNK